MSRAWLEVHAEILEIAYPSESSVCSVDHKIINHPMAPLLVRSLRIKNRRAARDAVCFVRKRSPNLSALTITHSLSQQSLFSFNRLQEADFHQLCSILHILCTTVVVPERIIGNSKIDANWSANANMRTLASCRAPYRPAGIPTINWPFWPIYGCSDIMFHAAAGASMYADM